MQDINFRYRLARRLHWQQTPEVSIDKQLNRQRVTRRRPTAERGFERLLAFVNFWKYRRPALRQQRDARALQGGC